MVNRSISVIFFIFVIAISIANLIPPQSAEPPANGKLVQLGRGDQNALRQSVSRMVDECLKHHEILRGYSNTVIPAAKKLATDALHKIIFLNFNGDLSKEKIISKASEIDMKYFNDAKDRMNSNELNQLERLSKTIADHPDFAKCVIAKLRET